MKSRIRTKLTMAARSPIATVESVAGRIHVIRRQKVMFDADLASLYGVTTKRFNEQVRRNLARFPGDFMFQLTEAEQTALRSQIAISNVIQVASRLRDIWTIDSDFMVYRLPDRSSFRVVPGGLG